MNPNNLSGKDVIEILTKQNFIYNFILSLMVYFSSFTLFIISYLINHQVKWSSFFLLGCLITRIMWFQISSIITLDNLKIAIGLFVNQDETYRDKKSKFIHWDIFIDIISYVFLFTGISLMLFHL